MPPPLSVLVDRFKRLPRRSGDAWEGGVVRARAWIDQPDGSVERAWAAVWVSQSRHGDDHLDLIERVGPANADVAVKVLAEPG